MPKRALVTGSNGQIGSYLVELLKEKGYTVSEVPRQYQPAYDAFGMDEIYLMHYTRPEEGEKRSYSQALRYGAVELAQTIEFAGPGTKIILPGSIRLNEVSEELSPWKLNGVTMQGLAAAHPNVQMPEMTQYISVRGNPARMYLMRVLHDLAKGVEPKPERPSEMVYVGHAKEGARFLWEVLNLPAGATATVVLDVLSVGEFIETAKTPGNWIFNIVEELKGKQVGGGH